MPSGPCRTLLPTLRRGWQIWPYFDILPTRVARSDIRPANVLGGQNLKENLSECIPDDAVRWSLQIWPNFDILPTRVARSDLRHANVLGGQNRKENLSECIPDHAEPSFPH